MFVSILGSILGTSILALNPSTIANAQAVLYGADYDNRYFYGDQYGNQYDNRRYYNNRYGYDNYENSYYPEPKKDKKIVSEQEIKCFNKNLNLNGLDITQIPQDGTTWAAVNEGGEGTADATNTQNGNGNGNGINFDRNLVNVCVNLNFNNQERTPILGDFTSTSQ